MPINYWVTSDLAMESTLSFYNDRFYDYGVCRTLIYLRRDMRL